MLQARLAKRVTADVQDLIAWCDASGGSCIEDATHDTPGTRLFLIRMRGAPDTPYAAGWFELCCELPADYPIHSPSVAFRTKIWHPNVHAGNGSVCMDVLNTRWTAVTRLAQVFSVYVLDLMRSPNPDSPLNGEAARQLIEDPATYNAFAAEYTATHAASA